MSTIVGNLTLVNFFFTGSVQYQHYITDKTLNISDHVRTIPVPMVEIIIKVGSNKTVLHILAVPVTVSVTVKNNRLTTLLPLSNRSESKVFQTTYEPYQYQW